MRNVHRSTLTAATIAAMAVLSLSACSNDSSTSASSSSEETTSAEAHDLGSCQLDVRGGRARVRP